MNTLEKILAGYVIPLGSFLDLIAYCRVNIRYGRTPLIAIELEDGREFVAFFGNQLRDNEDGSYTPLPTDRIYKCELPDGFVSENGECSYHIPTYPVKINKSIFKEGKVFVVNPETEVGTYIRIFMEKGRIEAQAFIKKRRTLSQI